MKILYSMESQCKADEIGVMCVVLLDQKQCSGSFADGSETTC